MRVVIVGRTTLDGALRLDRGLELVRTRSAYEALGELADPLAAIEGETAPTTVLVTPGQVPEDRSAAFAEAARSIDPATRLVLLGTHTPAGFDTSIDPQLGARAVADAVRTIESGHTSANGTVPEQSPRDVSPRETAAVREPNAHEQNDRVESLASIYAPRSAEDTVRGRAQAADDNGVTARAAGAGARAPGEHRTGATSALNTTPAQAPAPAQARAVLPVVPAATESGSATAPRDARVTHASAAPDAAPLEAMLAGKDVLAAALAGMGQRLGAQAMFTPVAADGRVPTNGVPVVSGGRVLGALDVSGAPATSSVLTAEAAWLGAVLALAAQQDQLRRAAFTDELTGAWNRRYFKRYLSAAIEHARSARHSVTLLVFDIDNFKKYNDAYGHGAGDEILCETVRLLTSVIRPTDRVCRIGGDEFAVVFHDPQGPREPGPGAVQGPQSIAQIAERFQRQIVTHRFPKLLTEAPGTLTISGGMATFPWDGRGVDELLQRADELAMTSKRQGKNLITFGPGAELECRSGGEGNAAPPATT